MQNNKTAAIFRKDDRSKKRKTDKPPSVYFPKIVIVSFVLSFASSILPLIFRKFLPPSVPLYYGLIEGEEQIVQSNYLIMPGVVSSIIILINLVISFVVTSNFLKKTLSIASLSISLLAIITTIKIIFLIGAF